MQGKHSLATVNWCSRLNYCSSEVLNLNFKMVITDRPVDTWMGYAIIIWPMGMDRPTLPSTDYSRLCTPVSRTMSISGHEPTTMSIAISANLV